jgi:hypothetical protein
VHFCKDAAAGKFVGVPIVGLAVILGLTLVHNAIAQDRPADAAQSSQIRPLGTVVNGNTTIIFEPADESDIDVAQLRTWSEFASEHAQIAHAIAHKPSVLRDPSFLNRHPELVNFFQEHPDIQEAMLENPGNFEAIPPRPGE